MLLLVFPDSHHTNVSTSVINEIIKRTPEREAASLAPLLSDFRKKSAAIHGRIKTNPDTRLYSAI